MDANEQYMQIDFSDPDEAPEWTDEQWERAEISIGGVVVRPASGTLTQPGDPALTNLKRQVMVELDEPVFERLRSSGPGWQTRVNAILREALGV